MEAMVWLVVLFLLGYFIAWWVPVALLLFGLAVMIYEHH